ncbi:hypothetical protein B0H13DRAFT_2496540 [Mycena leptocephala]|nr:hypothetical protein B0H13DRAFT_2496540 [Mycena leptocephala]
MEAVWTTFAQDHSNDPGKQAYALKTANMYWQMREDAEKKFSDVAGTWPSAGVSLAQHIRSERPDARIDWDAGVAEMIDVTSIIFCTALSEYDQVLEEEEGGGGERPEGISASAMRERSEVDVISAEMRVVLVGDATQSAAVWSTSIIVFRAALEIPVRVAEIRGGASESALRCLGGERPAADVGAVRASLGDFYGNHLTLLLLLLLCRVDHARERAEYRTMIYKNVLDSAGYSVRGFFSCVFAHRGDLRSYLSQCFL